MILREHWEREREREREINSIFRLIPQMSKTPGVGFLQKAASQSWSSMWVTGIQEIEQSLFHMKVYISRNLERRTELN